MKSIQLIVSSLALIIGGGLLLAGCSANVSLFAILFGYLVATGAAFTLTSCGDGNIIINPMPNDMDSDGFLEFEDCDDHNADINPDAEENCIDGVDNNCNGDIDFDDDLCITNPAMEDYDQDGYYEDTDCDDYNANVNPGATEDCEDEIDNDCDGDIDEEDDDCPEIITNPAPEDNDDDGFFAFEDCDDENADVNPGATENCTDEIDNDCDGDIDDADDDCPVIITNPMPDFDEDGYDAGIDCDDENPDVNPGATENCTDEIDNDCDGDIDDADDDCPEIITNPMPED